MMKMNYKYEIIILNNIQIFNLSIYKRYIKDLLLIFIFINYDYYKLLLNNINNNF